MDFSPYESESQRGKIDETLKMKNHHRSLDAVNRKRTIQRTFVENEDIQKKNEVQENSQNSDNSTTKIFERTSKSNSHNDATNVSTSTRYLGDQESRECDIKVDATSCKSCSVILERLPEKIVRDLLLKNNSQVKNVRGKKRRKQPMGSRRLCHSTEAMNQKNSDVGERRKNPGSKKVKSQKVVIQNTRDKLKNNQLDENTLVHDESPTSSVYERYHALSILLNLEKIKSERSTQRRIKGSRSRRKDSKPKGLRLNQIVPLIVKEDIADDKKDETCLQEGLQAEDLKESEDTRISSRGSEHTVLPRSHLSLDNSSPGGESRDKTLRTENLNHTEENLMHPTNSKGRRARAKKFRLTVRKGHRIVKNHTDLQVDPSSCGTLQLEKSEESSGNNVPDPNCHEHLKKRKNASSKDDLISIHKKRRKSGGKEAVINQDCKEIYQPDSFLQESDVIGHTEQDDIPEDSPILRNRNNKLRVRCRSRGEAPIVKNVRISLTKLESIAVPSTSKQVDNVKFSHDCIDINDTEMEVSELKTQRYVDVSKSCINKTKDTKITDYFFKIKRSITTPKSEIVNSNDKETDVMLKQKYGIFKDPIVLLVDCKKLKKTNSQCAASENKKVTPRYTSSFINDNLTSITTNELSPPSTSSSNTLPCSSSGLSENDLQSRTDIMNSVFASDHVVEFPLGSSYTDTVSITKNISPVGPTSPLKNSNESKTRSPDFRIHKATLRSAKKSTSKVRKSSLSPENPILSINAELLSNKSPVRDTDANSESSTINGVQEKSDAILQKDITEGSPNDNEAQGEPNVTSMTRKDAVGGQPEVQPIVVPIVKPPTEEVTAEIHVKQETPRRLPVNSMTILSRDVLVEHGSWIGPNDEVENLAEKNTLIKDRSTIEENIPSDFISLDKTTRDKTKASCNIEENVDNPPAEKSSLRGTVEHSNDAELSEKNRLSTQLRNERSSLEKSVDSKSGKVTSPKRPVCPDIGTASREENALKRSDSVQTKINDAQVNDLTSGMNTSVPEIPSLQPTASIEIGIDPIPVKSNVEDLGNSTMREELTEDSHEEGQLLIDTDESDSDQHLEKNIQQDTSTPGCSNTSVDKIIQGEEVSKQSDESSRKVCIICKRTFGNIYGLRHHLRNHVKCLDNCCALCDKQLTKKNSIEHYLEHCGYVENSEAELHVCVICNSKFKRKFNLDNHIRVKHHGLKKKPGKRKVSSVSQRKDEDDNQCAVCQLSCNSKEELFSHLYMHTSEELQKAFETALAGKHQELGLATSDQARDPGTSEKEKSQDKTQVLKELTKPVANTLAQPRGTLQAIWDVEASICKCHKDEKLEINEGVIIEIALACIQCKILFKSNKCFKDHYNTSTCKWSDRHLVTPKMFCNECSMILKNVDDLQRHLIIHNTSDSRVKISIMCKQCNILFFSIGTLFYTHWSQHWKDPLYQADHNSFPSRMKGKIEPGIPETIDEDQLVECLLFADYQCHHCDRPFQFQADLQQHLNSSESCSNKFNSAPQVVENLKPVFNLICSICLKEFKDKSTFDTHKEEHDTIRGFLQVSKRLNESLKENELNCSICKTGYATIADYKEHLMRHEVIEEKFVCNYCNLMMDTLEDFEEHSTEHKRTAEKPVPCKVIFPTAKFHCKPCKIRFDDQSTLDEHLTTHTNVLPSTLKAVENSTTEAMPTIMKKIHVCPTCQLEFDDQLKLDAHVSTHKTDAPDQLIVDPTVACLPDDNNLTTTKSHVCSTCHKEFDDQLKLDAHICTQKNDFLNPTIVLLSDDSNSTDVEIIASQPIEENGEPVVGNIVLQDHQETESKEERKKPAFLRVKNLKELLPYACSRCKSEFDTRMKLSQHVCTQDVMPRPDESSKYSCTICKTFRCNDVSSWNAHVLSHFPLRPPPYIDKSWFQVLKLSSGHQILKCNICQTYDCIAVHEMQQHFTDSHSDVFPLMECRICHSFRTRSTQEISRHEAAHFQKSSTPQSSFELYNSSARSVKTWQPQSSISAANSLGNDTSSVQLRENYSNSHQINTIHPSNNSSSSSLPLQPVDYSNYFQQPVQNKQTTIRSGNNSPSLQSLPNITNSKQPEPTLESDSNFNKFQQPASTSSITTSYNNLQNSNFSQQSVSSYKPDMNSNNYQQSKSVPPVANPNSTSLPNQTNDNFNNLQSSSWIPPVTSSMNDLSWLQPLPVLTNSELSVLTLQAGSSSNNPQQSILISGSNLPSNHQVENLNHQSISIPATTSSGNKLPSLQPTQNFNHSRVPGPTLQPNNNSNNFQQSIQPATSSGSNVQMFQPLDNSQWLTTTTPTLQIQINNSPPCNNMNNVMHSLPLYVTKLMYCCRICNNYKCSSEQEMKAHESSHGYNQIGETSKKLYRCKVCTNIFCPTEEHLKAHIEMYHNPERSNSSKNQKRVDATDTQQIKCKHCHQTLTSSIHLTQHMNTCHTLNILQQNDTECQKAYPYICQICSIGFLKEALLHAHIRHIHSSGKPSREKMTKSKTLYQCNICDLLLVSEETLNYHMKSHNAGY